MMLDPYFAHAIHPTSPSRPFVFGDASVNKNPSALIKGFAKAFGNNPSVRLIMRACEIRPETREIVNKLIARYGLTNVRLEEGGIFLEQYIDFLASLDCYINLSRGEGFSLIPREALALGLPVIISNNTALTTICKSGFVRAVPSVIKGSPLPHYKWLFDGEWGHQFDCKTKDAALAFRDVFLHYKKYIEKARKGREWVNQYSCKNVELQKLYRTLIRPKKVILSKENEINEGVITTNSLRLKEKYDQIIEENLEQE